MPIQRRIFLYLLGVVLGGVLAYFFYGQRLTSGDWLPENRIKQRLASTLVAARPSAESQLAAWPAELRDVRLSMPQARIDLRGSRRTPDSIYYVVRTELNGIPAEMLVAVLRDIDADTTATLWELHPSNVPAHP